MNRTVLENVRKGLTAPRKTLPYTYLYDGLGSALFEAITWLPEYGVSRAEARLLDRHARDIQAFHPTRAPVHQQASAPQGTRGHSAPTDGEEGEQRTRVVELGAGSATKTRNLLRAFAQVDPVVYNPVDISSDALRACTIHLSDLSQVVVDPINREYLEGLSEAIRLRKADEFLLVLFLGSTLGNLEPNERHGFVTEIRRRLSTGDQFLVGVDLVKDETTMTRAYDDKLGVTAAFNLNILSRLNREFAATFDLSAFRHVARYNDGVQRVEMHIESLMNQTVRLESIDLSISFTRGETIWTESSYKFYPRQVQELGENCGFIQIASWTDDEWPFLSCLWRAN